MVHKLTRFFHYSGKGLKIMNLGDPQATDGVTSVLEDEDDDAVDPHLVRVKNEAGGDESDEEVVFYLIFLFFCGHVITLSLRSMFSWVHLIILHLECLETLKFICSLNTLQGS